MRRLLTTLFVVLSLASAVTVMAHCYVKGVSDGWTAQQHRIEELYEELHPDLRVTWGFYVHPLSSIINPALFILGYSWVIVFVLWMNRKHITN